MSGDAESLDKGLNFETSNEVVFNLDDVYNNLKHGVMEDDDVDLNFYLAAYKELYNLFLLLGGAFQFMATDVKDKIKILENLQQKEILDGSEVKNFSSIKNMILYEKREKLLEDEKYVSGSRTLLRLHRGLDFVRHFFKEICDLEDNVKIGGVCRKTYDETLANYHGWMVKNSARLAMKLLPTREVLLKKISKNDPEKSSRVISLMPDLLETMAVVYNLVQNMYSENQLLNLP